MILQHLYNSAHSWLYYSLIGYAFFFASLGSRHFTFAVGAAFVAGPYLVLALGGTSLPLVLAAPIAVAICLVAGGLYRSASVSLYRRGSGSGQLLLISLGVLGITENVAAMLFGSRSQALWPFDPNDILLSTSSVSMTAQQLVFFVTAGGAVLLLSVMWSVSSLGMRLRALGDSRLGMMLRGYDVGLLETSACAIGFSLASMAGILWATELRVRPSIGLEASVAGVVTLMLAPLIAQGLKGVLAAALGITVVRLAVSLAFEGDWSMTATLITLALGLSIRTARGALRTWAH